MRTIHLPKVGNIYPNAEIIGVSGFYVPQGVTPTEDKVRCGWNEFGLEHNFHLFPTLTRLKAIGASVVTLVIKEDRTGNLSRPDYKIEELKP